MGGRVRHTGSRESRRGSPKRDVPGAVAQIGADSPVASRRRFVRSLGAGTLGASLAGCLTRSGSGQADDEVPIVYAVARSDPDDPGTLAPRRRRVPAEWLDELERAMGVHHELAQLDLDGLVRSFVVPGNHSSPGASISIHATADGVRDEIADLSNDVRFDVDALDEIPGPGSDGALGSPENEADLDDEAVPGGVLCGTGNVRGSLGPALYDDSTGDRYFVTSNHLYGGSGTDHGGESLSIYEGDERATVGHVVRGYLEEDLVLAEPANGYVPLSEIASARSRPVAGQFTALGLADLMARGERLEKVGAISGHTTGEIKGIDGWDFYTGQAVRTGQLLWGDESTFTDGDSGSVNYHPDPSDDGRLLVGGLNNARTWWPGADFTWGTAAYAIRESIEHSF